jgi:hypothetical protein
LIRPSKRKTRWNPVCPACGWTSAPRRPFGRFGAWFHPEVYTRDPKGLYYWLSMSRPPFSTNDGQLRSVYLDLERLLLPACHACITRKRTPAQHKQKARADLPSRGKDEQKRLVFLSLHDVKDHKGPNK